MSPLDVMKSTLVPLALYSPAGEVSGVTDGNRLPEEDGDVEMVGTGEGVLLELDDVSFVPK
jgi:hypothetical protein